MHLELIYNIESSLSGKEISMYVHCIETIHDVSSDEWNNLSDCNNPFLKHEFLSALEKSQCVGPASGWLPQYLVIYNQDELIAALPLFLKYNSVGEFVFDFSWAQAYKNNGVNYYPKLVSAVPFTPAVGPRFLFKAGHEYCYALLLDAMYELSARLNVSSFHCLFPNPASYHYLKKSGMTTRYDCQFFWFNNKYTSFDDFLAQLSSRKRKSIRRERKSVKEDGVTFRRLNGNSAGEVDWYNFWMFYEKTHIDKWNTPKFNVDFFQTLANSMPENLLLVLADQGERCIAGALMYHNDTHLYGRHWGTVSRVNFLHFETCYYQGIEYCIENRLQYFEPGVQGEHKIARGFLPVFTLSNHWIKDPRFSQAINDFCQKEKIYVKKYMEELITQVPFRKETVPPLPLIYDYQKE